MKHFGRIALMAVLALAFTGLLALSACGGSQSSAQNEAASSPAAAPTGSDGTLTIGTLATEDILPLWVAQAEGLDTAAGAQMEIVPFQSATELIAGVASGEVDLAMTDIMVAASMFAGGVDVQMEWVTLGTSADQGRFGIMVGPDSNVQTLADLESVPIGVGSNTILEYVMDNLMLSAGVPEDGIVVEELQKLPVRYQAMESGQVAAAALPGTLLALGEANGCRVISDDSAGENLSQSVMVARADVAADPASAQAIETLKGVWNEAAALVNADPEKYRTVLVESASLPAAIAETYPISAYPTVQLPTNAMVDPVLAWMEHKDYLTQPVSYDETAGTFSLK